jgi:hypothetical protein
MMVRCMGHVSEVERVDSEEEDTCDMRRRIHVSEVERVDSERTGWMQVRLGCLKRAHAPSIDGERGRWGRQYSGGNWTGYW